MTQGVYNQKRGLRRLKKLRRNGNLIGHDYDQMKKVVGLLSKSGETDNKRSDKQIQALLIPLIEECKFFK